MAELDLRASRLDLIENPGDDLAVTLSVVDASGDPVDLAGWVFTAPIDGTDLDLNPQVVSNTISLSLAAGTLPVGSYRWRLIGVTNGETTTWLAGLLALKDRPRSGSSPNTVTVTVQPVDVTVTVAVVPSVAALDARLTALENIALTIGGS